MIDKYLLSALCIAVLTACGHSHGDVSSVLEIDGDAAAGTEVFLETCAAAQCHGNGGNNGPAAQLFSVVPEHDDEALAGVIKYGEGDMPPQNLTDQEIADVMAHVRYRYEDD